jgi:glyoxylase-like metal-dependent hydrolase (beta-lactamase superfamily II)
MKIKALFVIPAFAITIIGQNVTQESYTRARVVLDRAVAAYGGIKELRAIENVSFRVEGETIHRNQSRRTFMSERTPYKATFLVDARNGRYRQTQDGWYPGGFHWVNGFAINRTEAASWDNIRGVISPIPNVSPANFRQRLRLAPQYIVLNAIDRASRLRYLGPTSFEGRSHSVLSYSNEDGLEIALYFDDRSSLLSKFEFLGTDPFTGDTVTEVIFKNYRGEGSRVFPSARLDRRGGDPTLEIRIFDVVFNAAWADSMFKPPDGLRVLEPGAPGSSVAKYSETVYTVNAGGYNVLAVGMKDQVFVMETPNSDTISRQAITEIRKLFPGKPIKYFAVTHHHDDHAGGLRTYVAEGATLISIPGEKTFFEKVAKSTFTIDPDSLTINPQPLKIETIEKGKRVLTDGTTTVELIDIGPGPHTEAMLVAYLPNEKLIFQGDLLNRPGNGDPPIANDTTVHFAKWLESSGLIVERVIGVHGPPSSMEEFRRAVADSRSAAK